MCVAKRDYGSAADHSTITIVTNDDRGSLPFPANAGGRTWRWFRYPSLCLLASLFQETLI